MTTEERTKLLRAIRAAFPESRVTWWQGNEDEPPCIWVTELDRTRVVKLSFHEETGDDLIKAVVEALRDG